MIFNRKVLLLNASYEPLGTVDVARAVRLVWKGTAEAVEPDGTQTLFRGSVLPQFGRGFVVDHAYPNIDVLLPVNHARMIRLRQLGRTDELFWSIHELQLWERGRGTD